MSDEKRDPVDVVAELLRAHGLTSGYAKQLALIARDRALLRDEAEIAARERQAREAEQRAETLLAAMDYAVTQGLEAAHWLKAWMEGDEETKAELDAHRATLEAAP